MKNILRYWRNQNGAGAAEFALVVIPFMAIIFGIINGSMVVYAANSLQYATEAGARCAAVSYRPGQSCNTAANIQTYAAGKYKGPTITPTFVYSTAGCGHTLTGTGTFPINLIVASYSYSLTATACFP